MDDRMGIYVKHIHNHPDCYNYRIETINNLFSEELDTINHFETRVPSDFFHSCPGHEKFIAHFSIKEKAKRKGEELARQQQVRANIKSVEVKIIDKNSAEGSESGHFYFLNRIYDYALVLIYYHFEGSIKCPNHPRHDPGSLTDTY